MSLLRSVLVFVSPLALAASLSGCTDPTNYIHCAADTDCPTIDQIAHSIVYDGGPVSAPPATQCCTALCVIPAAGCDSGYRFVTTHSGDPNPGVCVPNAGLDNAGGGVCPVVQPAAGDGGTTN